MPALLRFPGGVVRDVAVDDWFAARPTALGALALHWFQVIRECGSEVRELLHDGCPTACVGDAGFAYVNVFAAHVNVGFFRGALLPDPAGLLQGTGKLGRHVKLRPNEPVDAVALRALISAAHAEVAAQSQ